MIIGLRTTHTSGEFLSKFLKLMNLENVLVPSYVLYRQLNQVQSSELDIPLKRVNAIIQKEKIHVLNRI